MDNSYLLLVGWPLAGLACIFTAGSKFADSPKTRKLNARFAAGLWLVCVGLVVAWGAADVNHTNLFGWLNTVLFINLLFAIGFWADYSVREPGPLKRRSGYMALSLFFLLGIGGAIATLLWRGAM